MAETQHYIFHEDDHNQQLEGRYWNSGSGGICIMASITKGVDWAAYIGADIGWSEKECMTRTLEHGVKLSARDARYFFPEIKLPYRN